MLQPKRTKYRKTQKGRMKGLSQRGHRLSNGMFGIKSLESKFITSRQIEAARIAATRYMKREGQLWIKIFPDKPITKKPLEVRMGKGKGAPEYFVAVVKPEEFFEVSGVPVAVAKEALRLAAQKLPVKQNLLLQEILKDIMKISEIRNMSIDELNEKLTDTTKKLSQLKFNNTVQTIENPLEIKNLRRQLAKLKTILNEKQN